jgi:predicted acetyltransferase
MVAMLLKPSREELPAYIAALERGWSPDNVRGAAAAAEELDTIERDADLFLSRLHDPEALGDPIALPDGTFVPRLPGYRRWIWDGEFCGSIGLRWQHGTSELPSHVLGHIGFAVVPWKRGQGHAKRALSLLLLEARALNLSYVDLTTDPENYASQRVILSNGGHLLERFAKHAAYGGLDGLRFRIQL